MPVIVTFKKDWADEFDVEQFSVFLDRNLEETEVAVEELCKLSNTTSLYFGSSEHLENLEPYEFKVKEISVEATEELRTILNRRPNESFSFGVGILDYLFGKY